MGEIGTLAILVGGFGVTLAGFVWFAAYVRRRGLGGGVLGPVDEIYRPTAHHVRFEIQAEAERGQPSPEAAPPR
ncbi:hypothetical protein AB0M47_09600 [Hamadaea sp. NPDC051192]|uniref:hypothetical protein n=1 Tax=Hamadaea sp. NPDC051192 TaxID=3154940 RepID=UPI0034373FA2